MKYDEDGVLVVPREIVDLAYVHYDAARRGDPLGALRLAAMVDHHAPGGRILGDTAAGWRETAQRLATRTVLPTNAPTTTEDTMSAHESPARALYTGTAPRALRVEWMPDRVRFRVEGPGAPDDAIVDLDGPDVADLVETLTARPERLR